jgi:2,4-dienoyl-CoA reductase-like NADH-dependent reductase (Old Yellow Enzyme family)
VFTEATHVSAIGRITHHCLGLWNAQHQALLTRLAAIITRGGAAPGIQIAHAGRKASTTRTWEGSKPIPPHDGGWVPVAPSPIAFHPGATDPHALTTAEIADIAGQFAATARMAREAGFKVAEIHAAHGYLLHSFLSPIANHRNDAYGGDLDGRSRFLSEAIDAVRTEWPADLPLFVRLSCVDYLPGGLTIDDTVALSSKLAARGDVDLIDCSSGGISPDVRIPTHPGYQVPFADAVKHRAGIATGAVGLITEPTHAAEIVANERADLVFAARVLLADPAWPLRAAKTLGVKPELLPPYWRATLG